MRRQDTMRSSSCATPTARQHQMRWMKQDGMPYRDDSIGDHVLRLVRMERDSKNGGVVGAHLISVLGASGLGLRGSSALGLGLGLLGRHGDGWCGCGSTKAVGWSVRKCCIDSGVGSGMGYRVGLKIGWRETGNGGCGWAVALGGVPWCLYGKAGAHSHASDCADCAPLPRASLQATPLHLRPLHLGSVPYTVHLEGYKTTRPALLPASVMHSALLALGAFA